MSSSQEPAPAGEASKRDRPIPTQAPRALSVSTPSATPWRNHLLTMAGLTGLCLVLFFYRLGDRDLWSSHEARAGMNAQGLLDGGGWGLPRLYDGRPELQKPPLYYWLVAALAWLRGQPVDSWSVRLPAALSAWLTVLTLAGGIALARGRWLAGLLAGSVLACAVHFTWLARIGRIDMPLTMCVTVAIGGLALAGQVGSSTRRLGLKLAAYLALGAGFLLKGPIALVLPAAVLGIHGLCQNGLGVLCAPRRWPQLLHEHGVSWGLPLVALVTVPWVLWADWQTQGQLGRVFFWHHNIERALGGSTLRANPWWFYGPQLLGDFLPWSPLLLLGLAAWCRFPRLRQDPDARLGLTWLLVVLVVLSCSRFKRGDYLLPAYPGAALFLGCLLERGPPSTAGPLAWSLRRRLSLVGLGLAAVVVGWLIRVCWLLPAQEPYRDYRRFAADVGRVLSPSEPVVFFRTEAHPLAFHLRRPLVVLVQWEELEAWLGRARCRYVVMPQSCLADTHRQLPRLRVEPVQQNTAYSGSHERPLVLLRACPAAGS